MSLGIPYEFRPAENLICAGSLNADAPVSYTHLTLPTKA